MKVLSHAGIALLCCVLLAPAAYAGEAEPAKEVKLGVEFIVAGVITEQETEEDPFQAMMMGGAELQTSYADWIRRLKQAATDPKVSGVFITVSNPLIGWNHVTEIVPYLRKIRQAGKPVIVYADHLTTMNYILAAHADKVFLNPDGDIWMTGLMAQPLYFKNTLDKLGIKADIHHIGSHKGAGEPMMLTGPSKEAEEMLNWLLDDYYAILAEQVGKARGKDAAQGKAWLEGGPYTAQEALAAGLVDGLKNRVEAAAELRKVAGLESWAKLDHRYAQKKAQTVDFSSPFAIFKIFAELAGGGKRQTAGKPAIGVIYAEGGIDTGASEPGKIGSDSLVATIEKARGDADVKAVVLRIDSPGGSALASADIYAAAMRLKAEKPLVVSVGSVAASGGYYIAAPGEKIFVDETSIVGSIGVVGGKMVLKGLFDWAGITTHRYVRGGERATMMDVTTPFNTVEKTWVIKSMNEIYERFASAVKTGRGERLKDFEKVTGGKVFTGRQGVANGLADAIGGLDQAVAHAAERVKLTEYELKPLNKPVPMMQKMLRSMSGQDDEDARVEAPAGRTRLLEHMQALGLLEQFEPQLARAIRNQLLQAELLNRRQLLLVSPFEILLKH